MGFLKRCANPGCSSDTDSPRPTGWLFLRQTHPVHGQEENHSFCCWQCLVSYAYDQRPVL